MTHTSLWAWMVGSLGAGLLMVLGGSAAGSDIGQLAAGYGLLVVGSSLFLGFGLTVQSVVLRAAQPRQESQPSTGRILGHRV
jgi:hypothetical protein